MTRDEERAMLVECGAKVVTALVKKKRATIEMREAAAPLYEQASKAEFIPFSGAEQLECWRESVELAGFDYNDPMFDYEREMMEQLAMTPKERKMLAQLDSAELN